MLSPLVIRWDRSIQAVLSVSLGRQDTAGTPRQGEQTVVFVHLY